MVKKAIDTKPNASVAEMVKFITTHVNEICKELTWETKDRYKYVYPFLALRLVEATSITAYSAYQKSYPDLADRADIALSSLPYYNETITSKGITMTSLSREWDEATFRDYCNGFSGEVRSLIGLNKRDEGLNLLGIVSRLNQIPGAGNKLATCFGAWGSLDIESLSENEIIELQLGIRKSLYIDKGEDATQQPTPKDLQDLALAVILRLFDSKHLAEAPISFYDPTCGNGITLFRMANQLHTSYNKTIEVCGTEYVDSLHTLARLQGIRWARPSEIIKKDALNMTPSLSRNKKQHDIIFTHPPFSTSSKVKSTEFIKHAMSAVKETGIVVALLNGSAFQDEVLIKDLINEGYLRAVIQLPSDLYFEGSGNAFMWILSKHQASERKGIVIAIKADTCVESLPKSDSDYMGKKNKRIALDSACSVIINALTSTETSENYKLLSISDIVKNSVSVRHVDEEATVEHFPFSSDPAENESNFERFKLDMLAIHPNAVIDKKSVKSVLDFNFNKIFYKAQSLRSTSEILNELSALGPWDDIEL